MSFRPQVTSQGKVRSGHGTVIARHSWFQAPSDNRGTAQRRSMDRQSDDRSFYLAGRGSAARGRGASLALSCASARGGRARSDRGSLSAARRRPPADRQADRHTADLRHRASDTAVTLSEVATTETSSETGAPAHATQSHPACGKVENDDQRNGPGSHITCNEAELVGEAQGEAPVTLSGRDEVQRRMRAEREHYESRTSVKVTIWRHERISGTVSTFWWTKAAIFHLETMAIWWTVAILDTSSNSCEQWRLLD